MTDFLHSVSTGIAPPDAAAIAQARAVLDRFTAAFNAQDAAAMDRELHFPHTMLAGAQLMTWRSPGQHPPDFFESLRATGWAYTRYEAREVVLASAAKVHFVVTYTRRDRDGQVLSTHCNLWIVTRVDDRWGIALRSY